MGSPSSLARITRRMILPERVLGRLVVNSSSSGTTRSPTVVRTCTWSSCAIRYGMSIFIDDIGLYRGQWPCGHSWLQRLDNRRNDQDCARFCLPPRIHDGQFVASNIVTVPDPSLGINWLPYRTQQA